MKNKKTTMKPGSKGVGGKANPNPTATVSPMKKGGMVMSKMKMGGAKKK